MGVMYIQVFSLNLYAGSIPVDARHDAVVLPLTLKLNVKGKSRTGTNFRFE